MIKYAYKLSKFKHSLKVNYLTLNIFKMKNTILFIFLIIIVSSCGSDNLSNSKAQNIISECLDTKPEVRKATITIGKATFTKQDYDQELLAKYLKLTEDGYLQMELLKEFNTGWRKGTKEYSVKLNEKALQFMEKIPENGNLAVARAYKYEVDKVLEVQEIPAMNSAKVKIQYKAVDITPFSIFSSKAPNEFWIDDLNMKKTSNGWKYCDTF